MLEITSIGFDEKTGRINAMKGKFIIPNRKVL